MKKLYVPGGGGNYNVSVTNYNGCGTAVGIVLGMKNQFTVYGIQLTPNPVTDELMIKDYSQLAESRLQIFNILGECIYTTELNSQLSTVNCELFPSGLYFVQVAGKSGASVGRFVKE